jgi:hypothetical protein
VAAAFAISDQKRADTMSNESSREDINVRSDAYFIARTVRTCGCCRAPTLMLAVGLPPEHEALALDTEAESETTAQDTWERASCNAFLFYIGYLPPAVQRRLQEISSNFRFAHSERTQGSHWANLCERCGSLLDDHDLFCEPEGAFLPVDPAAAGAVLLSLIREPIEAAAAGYASDPEFFSAMSTA